MCTQCKEGFQFQTDDAGTNQCVKKDETFPVGAIIGEIVLILAVFFINCIVVVMFD